MLSFLSFVVVNVNVHALLTYCRHLCYQQKVNLCIYGLNGHGCFLKTFFGVINDEDGRTQRVDAIFTQYGL